MSLPVGGGGGGGEGGWVVIFFDVDEWMAGSRMPRPPVAMETCDRSQTVRNRNVQTDADELKASSWHDSWVDATQWMTVEWHASFGKVWVMVSHTPGEQAELSS